MGKVAQNLRELLFSPHDAEDLAFCLACTTRLCLD